MNKPDIALRTIETGDHDQWADMWAGYLEFYDQSLAPEVTAETWRRFFDDTCPLYCLVAEDRQGALLGFAAYVVHPGTWGKGDVCYLEDLFVSPRARCRGVARHMIEHLIAMGQKLGWYRLYWHTDEGNHSARALYDKIATLSDRVKYDVAL